jgi:papain fold toxin 1 (glutamine deamidase) of polymorphic toxin system
MSSRERRIIFHQIFFILSIFHSSYFACSANGVDPCLNVIRQTSKTDAKYFVTKTKVFVFFLVATVGGLWWPTPTYAASCDALVGKWAWFIGGEVTVNPDGTFVQQSGNAGTWECTDAVRGRFVMRWRDGGFVNSLALSPDGQGLTSTDQSQFYVTAQRSESAPAQKPQFIRKEDCCQEEYACETKRIEAEFDQARAQCHHPGNATCNSDAVKTKASQLKAANEKLRLCNRTETYTGPSSSPKSGDTLPPLPTSSDEFHSTERTGGVCQVCMPTQGTDQASGGGGDIFGSDSHGSDQGQPQPNGPGEVFGSDSGKGNPKSSDASSDCLPGYVDRDIPAASDNTRYGLGFSQAVRQCLASQVTIENLAVAAAAANVKEIAALLAIIAAPGMIDAVLHPPGTSPIADAYLRGKEEAKRLCEWGLKVSPVLLARCPAKGTVRVTPPPQRQTPTPLLKDLSWLRQINPSNNTNNCGNTVLAVEEALGGRGVLPAPPMSCAGTVTTQLESLLGAKFGSKAGAAEVHNMIFIAGEGARGIVFAKGPGGAHYFNIVRYAGEVWLLDGQMGRSVPWVEYLKMGLTEFQLLRTN